mmetsp:Transcript_13222/g.33664  ORF Transcript_13222/g.33664 Transcript_13222/m.33664 type:complete len:268 (+) Transcript_13222:176-979(+)
MQRCTNTSHPPPTAVSLSPCCHGQRRGHARRALHQRQPWPLPRRRVWLDGPQQYHERRDIVVGEAGVQHSLYQLFGSHLHVGVRAQVRACQPHRRLRVEEPPQPIRAENHKFVVRLKRLREELWDATQPRWLAPRVLIDVPKRTSHLQEARQSATLYLATLAQHTFALSTVISAVAEHVVPCELDSLAAAAEDRTTIAQPREVNAALVQQSHQRGRAAHRASRAWLRRCTDCDEMGRRRQRWERRRRRLLLLLQCLEVKLHLWRHEL